MPRIGVLIADDRAAYRGLIRATLEDEPDIEVLGEAEDGEEAIALTTEHAPHVVLMDIRMPKLSGIEATEVLSELHPSAKVLMLTISDDQDDLFDAIRAGALGYLLKDEAPESVVTAIRSVVGGRATLSSGIAASLTERFIEILEGTDDPALRPKLTNPEIRVLRALARGRSTEKIAEELSIDVRTVDTHVCNVLMKFHRHAILERFADMHTQPSDG